MHPDDVDLRVAVPAPDALENALCREHDLRRAQKQLHHLKLASAQAHALSRAREHTRAAIERRVAECEHRRPVLTAAAQHGPHAADELVGREGLGQIVVRPGVEARDAVVLLGLGREHHDRRAHALCAQPLEHLDAIELRHHDIEHDGVVVARDGVFVGVEAVVDGIDRELIFLKKDAQRLGEVALVLCDQQTHGASPGFILEVFCPERKHFHSASPVCSRPQEMFRLPLRQRSASRKALGTCASRSVTRYCSS